MQVNILGGLCAYGLTTTCCVSQAWATSEQENRRTLWRALALARWPNLGLGLQIDWRQRYRVLLQNGKPANRDKLDDPLADYAFVLQGRWGVGAAGAAGAAGGSDELSPSFSGVVAARTYAATVSLHGNDLEFRDAFQIEIKLRTPVPLPKALSAWSNPTNASLGATNASPPPWQCPSAPARPLRLLGAHLTALGGSTIPGGRGGGQGGLATALQSFRFHSLCLSHCLCRSHCLCLSRPGYRRATTPSQQQQRSWLPSLPPARLLSM